MGKMIMLMLICFVVVVVVLGVVGWGLNIVKLCQCDFESPFKAEFIRATGVFIPPVGAIAGYFEINDENGNGYIDIYRID